MRWRGRLLVSGRIPTRIHWLSLVWPMSTAGTFCGPWNNKLYFYSNTYLSNLIMVERSKGEKMGSFYRCVASRFYTASDMGRNFGITNVPLVKPGVSPTFWKSMRVNEIFFQSMRVNEQKTWGGVFPPPPGDTPASNKTEDDRTKKRRFKIVPIGVVHFEYFTEPNAFGIFQFMPCVSFRLVQFWYLPAECWNVPENVVSNNVGMSKSMGNFLDSLARFSAASAYWNPFVDGAVDWRARAKFWYLPAEMCP